MRELKTADIFKMSKILKKMGLKIDVENKTQSQVGSEFVLMIFENLHLAEKEVNNFLGSLIGVSAEEFSELPIEKTFEIINEFKNMPGIASFFRKAGQLTK